MKIDLDEIKRQLNVFLDAPETFITLDDLGFTAPDLNHEGKDRIAFHLLLIAENGCISNDILETGAKVIGLKLTRESTGNVWTHQIYPLRLTQSGHDFATLLNQQPILERLKTEAKEAPFSLLRDIGLGLAKGFLEKKLGLGH